MAIRKPPIEPVSMARPTSRPKEGNIDTRRLSPEALAELQTKTIAALRLNEYDVANTAKQMKIRIHTLRDWIKRDEAAARRAAEETARKHAEVMSGVMERRAEQKQAQDDSSHESSKVVVTLSLEKMAQLANEIVESLRGDLKGDKPQKFYDRAWAFGVVFDKLQVAQGNPTHISGKTEIIGMSRHQRLEQLLETAEERQSKIRLLRNEAIEQQDVETG